MIEINLLPGAKKKRRAARAGFGMPDFGQLATQVKDPLLLTAIGAWAVALLVIGFLFVTESATLSSARDEEARVSAEARRYQALISQKRREEKLRDSVVAELAAIRAIDSDRYTWPHILEEVTKALPDYTWLESVSTVPQAPEPSDSTAAAPPLRVLIDGRTADMSGYTRFLRQLGESPWLTDVVAGATKAVVEENKPILAFTITVTFRSADSAYIRTVPLQESVR